MIVEFTKQFIESGLVLTPGKKSEEFYDKIVKGLFIKLAANAKGMPSYSLRFKRNGTSTSKAIGTIKELSVPQARKLATQMKVELAKEAKLAADKPALADMTLDTFMRDHYFPHAKLHKRSWIRDDQLYRIRIKPKFGEYKLTAITRYEVEKFQRDLLDEGLSHSSASHHVKLMRHAMNLMVQWQMLDRNVLASIPLVERLVDNRVENYLDESQMKTLVAVLKMDACRTPAMILLYLLSTGARLNEALTATWKNVDEEAGVWKVDAAISKSRKSRSIPLNDSAKWVLAQLESKGQSEYLFPSPVKKEGKDVPYTTITRVWYRIRKLAGISSNVRIHDLRHSFLSLLARKGANLSTIQAIAGHAQPITTTKYIHLSASTLGEVANLASVIVPKPQPEAPTQKGVVVPFQKAA